MTGVQTCALPILYIAVLYDDGQGKDCPACELDVQIAFKHFTMHDETFDATERSLGAGIQMPLSMLLKMTSQYDLMDWRGPASAQKCYATFMGKAADVVNFTRHVVCANIRFVVSDSC